jgi:hypothetical protein
MPAENETPPCRRGEAEERQNRSIKHARVVTGHNGTYAARSTPTTRGRDTACEAAHRLALGCTHPSTFVHSRHASRVRSSHSRRQRA